MRLGICFTPMGDSAGSQITFARQLIPEIAALYPELLIFTSNAGAFENALPARIISVGQTVRATSRIGLAARMIRNYFAYSAQFRAHGCDVVYYPYTWDALHYVPRSPTFRRIVTVHDTLPLAYRSMFPRTALLWKFALLPMLRRADCIVSPSHWTRAGLIAQGGFQARRMSVIPNGVAPRKISDVMARSVNRPPYLLYVSSHHYPYKNIAFILRVYERLSEAFPYDLLIVGKTDQRFTPRLEAQRSAMQGGNRVTFLSELPGKDLEELYMNATLFVYPSQFEGFGLPPIEAMSHDVPVAASTSAAIPEVCGDAAVYFDPWNVDNACAVIGDLLSFPERRSEMVRKGQQHVSTFSWKLAAQRILTLAGTLATTPGAADDFC